MTTASLPVLVDLSAYRGDDWLQQFRLCDGPDVPTDLSGATIEATARSDRHVVTLDATIDDTVGGLVSIALPLDAIADVYRYDVEVTDADGNVTTWVRGQLTIRQDVTNADTLRSSAVA
jgi:hypothetical protein